MEVWGFKEKEDNSQDDGKSKHLVSKCSPCPWEAVGHREDFEQTNPASSLLMIGLCRYLR